MNPRNCWLAKLALTILMMVDGGLTQFSTHHARVQPSGLVPYSNTSRPINTILGLESIGNAIVGLPGLDVPVQLDPAGIWTRGQTSSTPDDDEVECEPASTDDSVSPDDTLDLRQRRLKSFTATALSFLDFLTLIPSGLPLALSVSPPPAPQFCTLRSRSVAIRC
ncbi:hypothetical protein EP7_004082 [Isosphaeraceae bacterium EP7]